jgi:hypothetical protein
MIVMDIFKALYVLHNPKSNFSQVDDGTSEGCICPESTSRGFSILRNLGCFPGVFGSGFPDQHEITYILV